MIIPRLNRGEQPGHVAFPLLSGLSYSRQIEACKAFHFCTRNGWNVVKYAHYQDVFLFASE
ncbi:MAG: hypothetical protein JWR09_4509 [Mucilaginibacter sp.]|nr:hypothetical protein [Mucilaginibacter sp.]